jgi:hypothetical protein
MGKGNSEYFDPMVLPDLTGDTEIDDTLKEQSTEFTLAMFGVIVKGSGGTLDDLEKRVVSEAIRRTFESALVTDDKSTWYRAKECGLNLACVYEEIKKIVTQRFFSDNEAGRLAAVRVQDAAKLYFEPGEARANTFSKPIPADDIYKAGFIVFSFGCKGGAASAQDKDLLALRQLSVAYISTNISNYCKYVRHCFNVKVWEEYQRWGDIAGSADIIGNAMTGGRKRGEVNIIITNDLDSILDTTNEINSRITQNIQNFAIGKVRDKRVRDEFCKKFTLEECAWVLNRINQNTGSGMTGDSKYKHAFCTVMDDGRKAIVKVQLPPAVADSSLFRTGVTVEGTQ